MVKAGGIEPSGIETRSSGRRRGEADAVVAVAELRPASIRPRRLPAVEPLGRQLVFTAKAMRSAFEDAIIGAGGSLASWIVLSALSETGCCSQAALASHVHLEGATITHHVDRLEKAGLVTRRLDPAD